MAPFLILGVTQGCLPPPRPWGGAPGGDDTGSTPQQDDTAAPVEPCRAVSFEDDGYLNIGSEALTEGGFYTTQDFTLEFWTWFQAVDLGETRTLVSLGPDKAWWLGIEGGDLVFSAQEGEVRDEVPDADWHHVAVVKDSDPTQFRVYVDGRLMGSALSYSGAIPTPEDDALYIARAFGDSVSWDSLMDRLRFSRTVRYENMTAPVRPAGETEGWLGVWTFSGDTKNSLTGVPASGNGYSFTDQCPPSE